MRHVLRPLLLALAMLASAAACAHPSIVYLVRHAEKNAGEDPQLTAIGQARAATLATILGRASVGAIYSTPTVRTMATAQPLARATGLTVQNYDPAAPKVLVAKIKSLNGAVLVVGHSNTLPELVRLFGGAPGADIADNEYDRLYQLIYSPTGAVTTVLLTVPPSTGAAP
jgi:broad specificity phosphatase PhoE